MATANLGIRFFKEFIVYLRSIWGVLSLIWTLVPKFLALLNASLIPPWPNNSVFLAGMGCGFTILWVVFNLRNQTQKRQLSWINFFFVCTLAGFLAWIATNATFVVPVNSHSVVKGFGLKSVATDAINSGEIGSSPAELANGLGQKSAEEIWTYVRLARIIVLVAFMIPFAAAAGVLTVFALHDMEKT